MRDDLEQEISQFNAAHGLDICLDAVGEIYGADVLDRMAEDVETVIDNLEFLLSLGFGEETADICNRFGVILLEDCAVFRENVNAMLADIDSDYVEKLGEDMSPWETLL